MNWIIFSLLITAVTGRNDLLTIKAQDQTSTSISVNMVEIPDLTPNITRLIASQRKPTIECTLYGMREIYVNDVPGTGTSESPVVIGDYYTLNGLRLYPITIFPQYSFGGRMIAYDRIDIVMKHDVAVNSCDWSHSMRMVFDDLILNLNLADNIPPRGYLIITPNSFADEVQVLADWKEKKGWSVTVATLSQTGSTPVSIKSYISNAYNTWPIPPEYVLLIGDRDSLPAYSTAAPVSYTDHPYTLITGSDFFSELLIGRLPANTSSELNTMIAKILGYEKDPYMADTNWYNRALVVAANYPIDTMTTPIATKRWVREKLMLNGFNVVDTVFYPPVSGPTQITTAIDQGVMFVNYRGGIADPDGWVYPNFHNTDIIGLNNGWKLPIVTSITCFTGNFGYVTCFGESWLRSGTPINPKGAVAFIGASASTTSSRWNNCLDYGIYWAILKENINNIGPALCRAKMEIYNNFPGDTSWLNGSSFYFHTYNLLGDPGLEIMTNVPALLSVNHVNSFNLGINYVNVQVQSSGQPLADALVSLYMPGQVKEVGFTDQSGNINMLFQANSADTLFITVTKQNHVPYCGFALITNSSVLAAYYDHEINDPGGNNNGEVNPGEAIEMPVTLKNYGTSVTATNVSARLRCSDPLVTITDSVKYYGSIAAGDTTTGSSFLFNVSTDAKQGHMLKFNLQVNSDQGSWESKVWLEVKAPDLAYLRHSIIDGGNNILEPGESAELTVWIKNQGSYDGNNITGIFRSLNPGLVVTDSIGTFGDIVVNDSASNNSNRFGVSAVASVAPGHKMRFQVILNGNNNFRDTIYSYIEIGLVNQNTPLGPDQYGYYAYDNTDTQYFEHPVYNWIEIDPDHGGAGDTISLQSDETKCLALPFAFTFYGQNYNRLSVSSNGYIAMDSTWIADMYNWRIPSAGGPPLLIAPFWDDLDPVITDSSGNICRWFDNANHRYIIEYSHIQHMHDPTSPMPAELQTFEIIFYDPQYYPTVSGDGEIVMQYNQITNDDIWHNYATVGIENYDHTIGLEYSYANSYPAAAAALSNGRAIKFTTDPPDTFPGVEEFSSHKHYPFMSIYPTPFCEKLHIEWIADRDHKDAAISIYDVSGRLVKRMSVPGSRSLAPAALYWDGTDTRGNSLPDGIYIIQLSIDRLTISRKSIMIKR